MKLEQARANMVLSQIQTWEVLDQRVLDCVAETPREDYVPDEYRRLAYADLQLPLGDGEVMLAPREEARLLQALAPGPGDKILEVGTGSGYLAALLAALGGHVVSIEISERLHAGAARSLEAHDVRNVTLVHGDGVHGREEDGPYDAIALTGSVAALDGALVQQLKSGGRLFAIVGRAPAMEAILVTRESDTGWTTDSLFETVVPALKGAEPQRRFVL